MKVSFEKPIMYLLVREEFYAKFLLNMRRHITRDIPTAGVNVTDKINLYVNPDFWNKLDDMQQVALLKHEVHHLFGDHITRRDSLKADHVTFNIAADAAINQLIPEMKYMEKEFGPVTVEAMQKAFKTDDIETLRETEYYYKYIKQEQKKNGKGKGGDGLKPIDDHDIWDKSDTDKELQKQIIKNTLEKTAKQTQPGNVPGEVKEAIKRLKKPCQNWKSILRNFVANSKVRTKRFTRNRRNRRYGLVYPGRRKEVKLNMACIIDTSASVDSKALAQFLNELDRIYKTGASIKMIECDTKVQNVLDYKPGKVIEFNGRGGTLYEPGILEAMKHEPDCIIYFGDGEIWEETLTKPKVPFLWAMIRNNKAPAEWGRKINIEV